MAAACLTTDNQQSQLATWTNQQSSSILRDLSLQLMYVTGSEDIEEDKDEVTAVTVLPIDVGRDEVIKAIDCLILFLRNIYWLISGHFH